MGRPSTYTPEMAALICDRLADGESLRAICRGEDMPGFRTVFQWLMAHDEFAQQYAHAREVQAHALAEDALAAADTATCSDDTPPAKLRYEARRWMASKLLPKVYGDRLQHAGPDGTGPAFVIYGVPEAADGKAWQDANAPTK